MYIVVSKWQWDVSHEAEVRASARKMMKELNSWDEVDFAYNVRVEENTVLAVIAYTSQAAYDRLINDSNGRFATAAREYEIEKYATWMWSERGEVEEP